MKPQNQNNLELIRQQLEAGRIITVQSVLRSVGTQELRHYISKLRNEGLDIQSKWVTRGEKHFKTYWIDVKILAKAC